MPNRRDAFKGVFIEMLREAGLLQYLISAIASIVFCLRHVLKLRVPLILGEIRSLVWRRGGDPGSLMVETCWLEVSSFLVTKLLSILRCLANVLCCALITSLDTATGNQARRLSLDEVENRKVGLYKRMYDTIKVSVLGLAINLAGGVGPLLLKVIRRSSGWLRRCRCLMNARCVLLALSRVGAGVAALSSSLSVYS